MNVEPNFKPDIVACPCGCGIEGRPRARAWKDGLAAHSRGCRCRRCEGGRHKKRASSRERKVGKAVGGARNIGSGAFGGVDTVGGVVDVEETANVALVKGLRKWWENKGTQDKVLVLYSPRQRSVPRAFVASWDPLDADKEDLSSRRIRPQLAVMTFEDFAQLCAMAQESAA